MFVQILAAALAMAGQPTFAQQVAKAKQGIIDTADSAFVKTWSNIASADTADSIGISAQQGRRLHLWGQLGATLGMCRQHSKPSDMADWLTSFDSIPPSIGPDAEAIRSKFRELGMGIYDEMRPTYLGSLGLTFEEQKKLCSVELEAARQIMKGL